jgi:hypothetical protein
MKALGARASQRGYKHQSVTRLEYSESGRAEFGITCWTYDLAVSWLDNFLHYLHYLFARQILQETSLNKQFKYYARYMWRCHGLRAHMLRYERLQ